MLAGHFALAAAVKSRQPQVPLWALMVATQLLDLGFLVLVPLGYESYTSLPNTNGGYGEYVFHADYTHSLVGALGISLLAMLVTMIPWGRVNGMIIGAVVFSHWILDLPLHHSDMPILPGNAGNLPILGFGLWSFPWISLLLELLMVLVGGYLYYHAAMRTAIKAERQETKAGTTPKPYRQQSLITSIVLFVALLGTLVGDFLGLG